MLPGGTQFCCKLRIMEKKKIISVSNLVKNYGNFQAVKGISFDVFEGEIFGLPLDLTAP